MKYFIYILTLFSVFTTKSESLNIDSLRNVLNTELDDTSRINTLLHISENIYYSNPDSDVVVCQLAIELAESKLANDIDEKLAKFYKEKLATALNNIAFNELSKGETNKALDKLKRASDYYLEIDNKSGVALVYSTMGVVMDNQGKQAEGLDYHYKSLNIREELKDTIGISKCLNNIGYVYYSQEDYTKALEYYVKAKELNEALNSKQGFANTVNNIGMTYKNLSIIEYHKGNVEKYEKMHELAVLYINKTLRIYEELGYKSGIAIAYINLGGMYQDLNKLDLALKYYQKSLEVREELGEKNNIVYSLSNIATTYYLQKKFVNAKTVGEQALKLANEIGYPETRNTVAYSLNDIYKALGEWKKAYEMKDIIIQMTDSIKSKDNEKAIVKKQIEYDYEKQKAIDDIQNEKQLAIEHAQQEKQKIVIYAFIGGLFLMLIFLIIVINRWKITKTQKVIIEETNEELNQTNEEIAAQRDEIEEQKQKVEEAHSEVQASINYAKRIQNAILPAPSVIKENLPESFVLYKPKDVVAGDFYWLEQVANTTFFAAADCTGHGVPGAMVSVVCHNAMNRAVREFKLTEPGLILDKTREIVVHEFEKSEDDVKDGMDIALCSLIGNKLQYAGAHNPLWIVRNGEILETKADKQPIGKFDKPTPFVTHSIELQKEDSVYIFSDGFADQFGGEKDKKFSTKQFKKLLISIQEKSMNEQKEILNSEFLNWISKGSDEQIDDVCVFGVKF